MVALQCVSRLISPPNQMSWFQLDPKSIAERTQYGGAAKKIPSLQASLLRGTVGFTAVSVAGFAPWAVTGRWLRQCIGEAGLYAVCAFAFIVLSGLLLHQLIMGLGSLGRFYKVFGISFAAYSVAWIVGWMSVGGHWGSITGLLAGTAVMGWMLARAFDATRQTLIVIAVLFVLNSLGYFLGGVVVETIMALKQVSLFGSVVPKPVQMTSAKLLWGVFYGLGFGAGLGLAFHICQTEARALLASSVAPRIRGEGK